MASETILMIDDNEGMLTFLDKQLLSPLGFSVYKALNGETGLALAAKHMPDLILLDMNLPRMTGLDLLAKLRQADCCSPAILMTTHGSVNIPVEALRLGVRDYIGKPFTSDEIRQIIDRALHESRLLREQRELNRNLLTAETVRVTVVTLSHYLNNYLTTLKGGLTLLEESLDQKLPDPDLFEIIKTSRKSALSIQAVMKILLDTTNVKLSNYTNTTPMIDIEKALQDALVMKSDG